MTMAGPVSLGQTRASKRAWQTEARPRVGELKSEKIARRVVIRDRGVREAATPLGRALATKRKIERDLASATALRNGSERLMLERRLEATDAEIRRRERQRAREERAHT